MSMLKETKTLSSVRAEYEGDEGEAKGCWLMGTVEGFENMELKMIEGLMNDENGSSTSQRM